MAVKRTDGTYEENGKVKYVGRLEFQCLTSDVKPILNENQSGSTLVTLDSTTKKTVSNFIWHVDDWYEVV